MRPEVRAFAEAMEAKLKANDWKEPWRQQHIDDLRYGLEREYDEMDNALDGGDGYSDSDTPDKDAMAELIDVANYAMMIWDKLRVGGGLDDLRRAR